MNQILVESNEWPYLNRAMTSYIQRFPSSENGLGAIESKILDLSANGPLKGKQIIKLLLKIDRAYGFGDLQYMDILVNLSDLYTPFIDRSSFSSIDDLRIMVWDTDFEINEYGQSVLNNRAIRKPKTNDFIGGARRSEFQLSNSRIEQINSA